MIKQAMFIAFTLPIIDDSISVILGDFLWNSPPPSWLWWVGCGGWVGGFGPNKDRHQFADRGKKLGRHQICQFYTGRSNRP